MFRLSILAGTLLTVLAMPVQAEIRVGVAVPLSGAYTVFGEQIRYGAEAAADDLNAAGGVLGGALKIEIADDKCDEDQATAIANQMVGKKIDVMIGHFCSAGSIAASKVYAEQSIIQISPASPNPKFTFERPRSSGGTYRVYGHLDEQASIAAGFLVESYADKRVGFAHDRTAYGRGLAESARKTFRQMGGEEALRIEFTAGEVAYPGLISRLQAEQIDILFIGGYDTETAIIAQQIRAAGLNTQIMGGDTLMSEEFWAIAGEAGQGTLLTYMPDLTIEPAAQLILANFQKNNQPVDGYAAYAYAAVQVFAQAAIKAGSADYNALTDVLNGETFATVLGEVAFDPFGNNTRPGYSVFRWTDGDVLPIQ